MKYGMRVALAVFALFASAVVAPAPASAVGCEFVLGFKALHDAIPDVVGECTSGESHNPTNGDGIQNTTAWHGKGGLLVWRKSDNWTAFTDGASTWINGPYGIQKRGNNERFPWEKDPVAVTPPVQCSSNPSSVVKGPNVDIVSYRLYRSPWNTTVADVVVRNNCAERRTISLRVRAYSGNGAPPSSLGNEVSREYAPFEEHTLFLYGWANPDGTYPNIQPSFGVSFHSNWVKPGSSELHCVDVGASRCLPVDPMLRTTVDDLSALPNGSFLLKSAAQAGVSVRYGELPFGVLGSYQMRTKVVTLWSALREYSEFERVPVLAHELTHASYDAAGQLNRNTRDTCYAMEEKAFRQEANAWSNLWHSILPRPQNSLQADLNSLAIAVRSDPLWLTKTLLNSYGDACE